MPVQPGGQLGGSVRGPSHTQLFPFLSKGGELGAKGYLWPAIATAAAVVMMLAAQGRPGLFRLILALYISAGMYYFVYRICGKPKSAWLIVGSAGLTALLMSSPVFTLFAWIFRDVLPGHLPANRELWKNISFPVMLFKMFFAAGLMEELFKALPVFGLVLLGTRMKTPWRERIGVVEPLDGVLIGAASALGFVLVETMGQYVPESVALARGAVIGRARPLRRAGAPSGVG